MPASQEVAAVRCEERHWQEQHSEPGRGDRVIANSRYTAELIVSRHRVKRERIRVIYRGVDLSEFSPELVVENRIGRLRALWGVSERQPVILQAARRQVEARSASRRSMT